MRKTFGNFAGERNMGFTLMELLVVIAIIMLVVGILVPGLRKMKIISRNLSQKSMFHSIEIGLELFAKDFGDYPDSEYSPVGGKYYCGAQHLAEAMIGRDGKGYEPAQSDNWTAPGQEPSVDYNLYWNTVKSLGRRKGNYVDLKDSGAFDPSEIYTNTVNVYTDLGGGPVGSQRGPVLTDIFRKKKITLASGVPIKIGSPVLYFKANVESRVFKKNGPVTNDVLSKWTYNYEDNRYLFKLESLKDSQMHHFDEAYIDPKTGDAGYMEFYQAITDAKVAFDKPYNATTFILMSAGEDSIFGTKDDVTNFNY